MDDVPLFLEEDPVSFLAVQADDGRRDLDFDSLTDRRGSLMKDGLDFLLEDKEELSEAP